MKAVFFSDVHLVPEDQKKTRLLRGFLEDFRDADIVVILGDLFEFYHGYDNYIYPWYEPVTDVLKKMTENGSKIYFLEGNHEFELGCYFTRHTGVVSGREMVIQLDGKRIFLSHGDTSGLFCLGSVLKNRFTYWIMDMIGPMATWKCAEKAGFFLSRKRKPYDDNIKRIFRENGRRKLKEGYDAVIFAHSHMVDKIEFEEAGKKQTYLNTGDFGRYFDYVLYDSDAGFSLKTYLSASRAVSAGNEN